MNPRATGNKLSFPHPSTFLSAGVADVLRSRAAEAEAGRDLHPDQLELIYASQWFRMLLPENPLALPDLVRLEEGISWADGSVGWTVTLCSGAGWFAGFFPSTAFPDIFSQKQLCLAGSGAPTGEAQVIPGGFRVNGRWDYASGALHATAFTANCLILDKGGKVRMEDGQPLIRPFLFRKEEVIVDKSWNTIGLIATASHAFEMRNVEIPADRCFTIGPGQAKADHPIYRYPFLQLAEATLAVNLSGMAMHFLDCCETFFRQRIQSRRFPASAADEMNTALERAKKRLEAQRMEFYETVDHSWQKHIGPDGSAGNKILPELSRTSRELVTSVRTIADGLYPYGGLGAARPDTEINRVWRDLHTASQHNLLVFGR
jgi:alkylation response protein AidB-like acyl-CoA dehydrogenase